ncbi:CHAT domain-containing protein [Kribbella sp. NPDC051952]|uniref:CHAT domain-containing protein n=1 Tax=Kribbella sp. NPDC051952 TaxID=3154851 RepID=UPI003434A2A8
MEQYLAGLGSSDEGDSGNALFAWSGAILIKISEDTSSTSLGVLSDDTVGKLYELLAREYSRFGDWKFCTQAYYYAAECRASSSPSASLRLYMTAMVCSLKAGDAEVTDRLLAIAGEAEHPDPAVPFFVDLIRALHEGRMPRSCTGEEMVSLAEFGDHVFGMTCAVLADRFRLAGSHDRALQFGRAAADYLGPAGADGWIVGNVEQQVALARAASGDYELALRSALVAWAKLDSQRYRACDHTQRLSLWKNMAGARWVALSSALALGDVRTLVELIEACRVQSILATETEVFDNDEEQGTQKFEDRSGISADGSEGPSDEAPDSGKSLPSLLFKAMEDAQNSNKLGIPSFVTYQGFSRLAQEFVDQDPDLQGKLEELPLEYALPAGLFWSSHIENAHMFWYVARDGEVVSHGMTDLRVIQHLTPILTALTGYSHGSEGNLWNLPDLTAADEVEDWEPFRDLGSWRSVEEEVVCRTIGNLLPPALVELINTATGQTPILTLASSRELSCVPWAIALMPGLDTRLIEHVALQMWTSVRSESVRRRRCESREPEAGLRRPFLIACDNPDGTLRDRSIGSSIKDGAVRLGTYAGDGPALKQVLLRSLHEIGSNTDGLFFYRGHSRHSIDPATTYLPLQDEPLYAGELFGQLEGGIPFAPMPSMVILSCCSSSTGALLGGEGIGLVAGLIQAGADEVIATSIDILDVSFTGAFDDFLIDGIRKAKNGHAHMLRELQLRMLQEWKIFSTRGGQDWSEDVLDPHPIIWAFYHAY